MKVKYEFDTLDENYDRHEHEMYKQSFNMMIALSHIQDKLRDWLKWDSFPIIGEHSEYWDILPDEKQELYKNNRVPDVDAMANQLYDIIEDAGVRMEDMGY